LGILGAKFKLIEANGFMQSKGWMFRDVWKEILEIYWMYVWFNWW